MEPENTEHERHLNQRYLPSNPPVYYTMLLVFCQRKIMGISVYFLDLWMTEFVTPWHILIP